VDSRRCWECRQAVILFLRAWDVSGFEGGDKMERYLPVLKGGMTEAGIFQGGLRCWMREGLFV